MKKSKIITIIILVAIVAVAGTLFLIGNKNIVLSPALSVSKNVFTTPSDVKSNLESTDNNKSDLVSFSIPMLSQVSGIKEITGTIKGGYFFEGNIILNILDANKKLLRSGHGTATTDWMTSGPVDFKGTLDFTNLSGPAYVEIHNDNASGLPANDKSILIPIIIN